MDRPLGPRQPDPKRQHAFENIFGRPTPPAPPTQYPQHNGQPHPYPDHGPQLHRRPSNLSYAPSGYAQQPQYAPGYVPPAQYRPQSYYPPHGSPQPPPAQSYYPSYAYPQPSLAPPTTNRARSVISNQQPAGIISPKPMPDETSDPALDALVRSGMTPAQAYQYQVYMNSPQSRNSLPNPNVPDVDRHSPVRHSIPNGDIPQLGVNIDYDNGRLNLDFTGNGSSPSDDADGSSSELPWASESNETRRSERESSSFIRR